mgnify:FL=1
MAHAVMFIIQLDICRSYEVGMLQVNFFGWVGEDTRNSRESRDIVFVHGTYRQLPVAVRCHKALYT